MKKQVFILTLIGILCLISQYAFCQLSEGGTPISFSLSIDADKETIPAIVMPLVDVKNLLEEDARKEDALSPFRFGYDIDVDIDIKEAGLRKELPNGDKVWLLKIHSKDAFSINLIYSRFKLGKGSRFFIYNEDRTMVLGAFTPETSNNEYNEFATDLVQGNTVVLEYYEPKSSDDGVIYISKVIHGYINLFYSRAPGNSAACNIDITCVLGDNWLSERRSIMMILTNNNTAICTGCLMNNTAQNYTPYILTARHCFFVSNGPIQTTNPTTCIFWLKYWRPCGTGSPGGWQSFTGATLRAHNAPTDFALLELNTRIPAAYNVYYAGWDRTATPAQTATTIHHPQGDAMKISREEHAVTALNQAGLNLWRVQHFEQGIVQHGSSGAPLFNQNHRVVGQLHGNLNNVCGSLVSDNPCHCNQIPIGDFGRFDLSWTGGGTNATRLSNWLDPLGTAPQTLDGRMEPVIIGPSTVCGTGYFTNANSTLASWTLSGPFSFSSSSVVTSTTAYNVTVYQTGTGSGTITVSFGAITDSKAITACPIEITGPSRIRCGYSEMYYMPLISGASYSWSSYAGIVYVSGSGTSAVGVAPSYIWGDEEYDAIVCTFNNVPKYKWVTISDGKSPVKPFPNPVSDILNVEIEADAIVELKTTRSLDTDPTFDIRLYDSMGNLVRQTATKSITTQFNVTSLPSGVYSLHVYNGVHEKPVVKQIVIQR